MGDARHQPPECGELFRLDQRILGLAQVPQRRFGGVLGLAHLQLAALALANVERDGDDIFDIAVAVEKRKLVHQPLPHIARGIHIFLFVESEPPARRQHPLVVLVGLLRAVARHQIARGATDRIRRLDAEDTGHVAVHQHVAQLLVLDVDHRRHGVDHLLQQPPAFGDGILGALLIRDVAHRPFIADGLARLIANHGSAVGEPQDRTVARAHLILELANRPVAPHQLLVFRARRGVNVNRVRDVADAVDQILRRLITQDARQRRVGVEQRAVGRRHVNSVDRPLEQLAIAFLGEALLGQGMHRRLARGVGIDQRAAEYLGGTRNIADLIVHVGGGNRCVLLASRQRADRSCDGCERADGSSHDEECRKKSEKDAGGAQDDALPFSLGQGPREITGQHVAAARADLTQQFGDLPDQASLRAENVPVDIGDLTFADRYRDDRVGVMVDGRAKPGI